MNRDKKYHSLAICLLLSLLIITVFTTYQPSQMIIASGVTIYSPYWIHSEEHPKSAYFEYCGIFDSCFRNENYQEHPKSAYFEYCGIFDSCFHNDIRTFPSTPLTTHGQKNVINNITPKNTISSIMPFELPFP